MSILITTHINWEPAFLNQAHPIVIWFLKPWPKVQDESSPSSHLISSLHLASFHGGCEASGTNAGRSWMLQPLFSTLFTSTSFPWSSSSSSSLGFEERTLIVPPALKPLTHSLIFGLTILCAIITIHLRCFGLVFWQQGEISSPLDTLVRSGLSTKSEDFFTGEVSSLSTFVPFIFRVSRLEKSSLFLEPHWHEQLEAVLIGSSVVHWIENGWHGCPMTSNWSTSWNGCQCHSS